VVRVAGTLLLLRDDTGTCALLSAVIGGPLATPTGTA
jgi:hypothetical protein